MYTKDGYTHWEYCADCKQRKKFVSASIKTGKLYVFKYKCRCEEL